MTTQFIYASDYGATGNGTTDDTVALQNAINAAIAQRLQLVIAPGDYKITSPFLQCPGMLVITINTSL
jgi:polygalacturonase